MGLIAGVFLRAARKLEILLAREGSISLGIIGIQMEKGSGR